MAELPREPIQITARRNGAPEWSTATVPAHCALHPIPTTLEGETPESSRARRAATTMAAHHATGSCSAPPPGRKCRATGSDALATILPFGETTAALGPPVPRSTASTTTSSAGRPPAAPPAVTVGGIDPA